MMEKVLKNRKGMYEYILTKSVMLIFILGLVVIFYNLYQNLNVRSAGDIANGEAARIAKEVDDVISVKGTSSKTNIYLSRDVKVGRELVAYTLQITDKGIVIINFTQYPYQGIAGFARFGIDIERKSGKDMIDCTWSQILGGAFINVTKESEYYWNTSADARYYNVSVTLDATESCYDSVTFAQAFEEK